MALHPASVKEGERVLLVHTGTARVYKGWVVEHTRGGDVVMIANAEGRPARWQCAYSDQGTIWAKGWSDPAALLAAFRLDASAR